LRCNKGFGKCRLIDDPVGAATVHGVGGVWSLLCGAFCSRPGLIGGASQPGLLFGGDMKLLAVQSLACIVLILWSVLASLIHFKIIDCTCGLRASDQAIEAGFDIAEHGILGEQQTQEPSQKLLREVAELKSAFAALESQVRKRHKASKFGNGEICCDLGNNKFAKTNVCFAVDDEYDSSEIPRELHKKGEHHTQIQGPYKSSQKTYIQVPYKSSPRCCIPTAAPFNSGEELSNVDVVLIPR